MRPKFPFRLSFADFRHKIIIFSIFVFVLTIFAVRADAAVFTVNNTGDAGDTNAGNGVCATSGGVCTLRAALNEANALAGADTINFAIGSGQQTITVTGSPLPVSSSVVIDGTTQPGWSGAGPFIFVDGANSGTIGFDFALVSGLSVTFKGLAIGRFSLAGIKAYLSGTTVRVERCHIGVGLDGITDMGNGDGIWAVVSGTSGSSLILGDASGGGNVISGNQDMGVEIEDVPQGAKLSTFLMEGNIIGLASDGMTAVPNSSGGIRTDLQFSAFTVGGSIAARNIISGNGGSGILWSGFFQADTLTLSSNYIGVAKDGITARGNNGSGGVLVARQFNIESNVVAANTGNGLSFSTCNIGAGIRGNRIGVALDGSPRGNGGSGIVWNSGNCGGVIGGAGNQNIIAYNGVAGVRVSGTGQIEIAENSIFSNSQLGIDLGTANVVDPNDAGDADTGNGNNVQNRPTVASAIRSGGLTFVTGGLSSAPNSSYAIRLYSNSAADPSGFGEGETYLGLVNVTTNASGDASFNLTVNALAGSFISATARAANGDTSEFSNALAVLQTTYTILGRVLASGNPVSGAAVELSGSASQTAMTDSQGRFRFENLVEGGSYIVTPSPASYTFTPASLSFVNLQANQNANFTAAQCSFSLNQNNANVPASASSGSVTVTAPAGCEWTASANDSWLTITSALPKVGVGTINYSITANAGAQRSGSLTIAGQNFSVTQAAAMYNVSGVVTYGANDANQPVKFVSGVLLAAAGSSTAGANSDSSGVYLLGNLSAGGQYEVTLSKTGGANGITAFDATLVLRCVAAGAGCALSANQRIAADANGDDTISAFDATQILRFVAANGTPNAGTGIIGSWKFNPLSRNYSIIGSISNENYEAILVGEISGDWTP